MPTPVVTVTVQVHTTNDRVQEILSAVGDVASVLHDDERCLVDVERGTPPAPTVTVEAFYDALNPPPAFNYGDEVEYRGVRGRVARLPSKEAPEYEIELYLPMYGAKQIAATEGELTRVE